jgi:Ser/Thr protein kinase RdoA (MazF antagonist)
LHLIRICRDNGITHRLTEPACPTTTRKVERFHKIFRVSQPQRHQHPGLKRQASGGTRQRLGNLAWIDEHDAAFLRDRAAELAEQYENLSLPLGYGPIHGDANVGNVILSSDGCPVLIDLDSFATGPRVGSGPKALFYDRFGWHTAQEYRTFVDVYGSTS